MIMHEVLGAAALSTPILLGHSANNPNPSKLNSQALELAGQLVFITRCTPILRRSSTASCSSTNRFELLELACFSKW